MAACGGVVPQHHGVERGTVAAVGQRPTIRSHKTGEDIRFAYRSVKRRSHEGRHHFQVGDVVRFRRSPQRSNTADGLAVPKAEQVWVVSPIRAAPSAAPMQAVALAPQALPVAVPVAIQPTAAVRCWRHDPYSFDSSAVAIEQ
eukprot:TRINITY_DN47232_c0_g1_i1.p2 TRINITY_DN47232_c0_g1~~TRINITY_DN47232_c0_g1_i1.p2  ORF type:complete len:143 (+),score=17.28 TRINITY_DN47232_c0_g1_i1:107-535(+)